MFVLGAGFIYNEMWRVPNLRYTMLPSYQAANQYFSGLVLENRGRAAANGVLIKVSALGTPIDALEIQSDELFEVREGGEGKESVAIWLDRLTTGASVTVYLLTAEDAGIEDSLTITADRGLARPAASTEPGWSALLGAAAIGFMLAGLVGLTAQGFCSQGPCTCSRLRTA